MALVPLANDYLVLHLIQLDSYSNLRLLILEIYSFHIDAVAETSPRYEPI